MLSIFNCNEVLVQEFHPLEKYTAQFFFLHVIDEHRYEIYKRRILQGKSVPHYASIEPGGDGLMIISYKPFKFVQEKEEILEENDDKKTTNEKKGKPYLTVYDRLLSVLAKKRACLEILVDVSLNICLKCFFFFLDPFIYFFILWTDGL